MYAILPVSSGVSAVGSVQWGLDIPILRSACAHRKSSPTVWHRLWSLQSSEDTGPFGMDVCRGSPCAPGPSSLLLSSARLPLPMVSHRLLCCLASWQVERQEMGARKGEEARVSLPASFLLWHSFSSDLYVLPPPPWFQCSRNTGLQEHHSLLILSEFHHPIWDLTCPYLHEWCLH